MVVKLFEQHEHISSRRQYVDGHPCRTTAQFKTCADLDIIDGFRRFFYVFVGLMRMKSEASEEWAINEARPTVFMLLDSANWRLL